MTAFELRLWILLCAAFFPLFSLHGQTQFLPLGYLDDFGPTSEANAVMRDGTKVIGYSTTSLTENLACWWTTNGIAPVPGVQHWLANAAYAISADGNVIVGDRNFGTTEEAWYWTPAGDTQLVPFPETLRASTARGVTGNGQVVVGTATAVFNLAKWYKAFRWDRSQTTASYLPVYSTTYPDCGATAISDDAQRIIGIVATGLSTQAAARWDNGGAPVPFSKEGDTIQAVSANALTPDGSIVVGSAVNNITGKGVAFKWTAATGVVALPNPTTGGRYAIDVAAAMGVSGNGRVIVGYGENVAGDDEAIVWMDEQPYRVAAIANSAGVLPSLWETFRAYGADYFGNLICGYGRATSGKLEAFLLVLDASPAPPALVPPSLRFAFTPAQGLSVRYQTVPGLRYRIHGGNDVQALAPLSDWNPGFGIDQEFLATPALTGSARNFFLRLEVALK